MPGADELQHPPSGATSRPPDRIRSLIGALLGAAAGYILFRYLVSKGMYAPLLPGALSGIGCGMGARTKSHKRAALCAAFAALFSLWSEWSVLPFYPDGSLSFFIRHIPDLQTMTLVMYGAASIIAYYFGYARQYAVQK